MLLPAPDEEIELERGLASLPPPSPGDLFFDIEGDPYALDDGLDYLFGVLETDGTFHAIWSRDDSNEFSLDGERRGFERLMDLVMARLEQDPAMHVYHYAPYEPTALKRLMGRYGTREDDVDRLLRQGVMVDLLRVVRQSLRASVESYSIKKMEPFYGFTREIDLRDAGSSIVAFEQWLELAEGDRPAAMHLERIERYNKDDVVSNLQLRDWLEGLRAEFAATTGREVPRPALRLAPVPPDLTEAQARVEALVQRMAGADVMPTDPLDRTPTQQATWLLAQLLGWHRREGKSAWWEFHRLMDLTPEDLVDEDDPIGLLEPLGPVDESERASRSGATGIPPRTTTSAAARSSTRPRSRHSRTRTRSGGLSATWSRSTPPNARWTCGASSPSRTRGRSSPFAGSPRRRTRRPFSILVAGWQTTESRPPGRPAQAATCCSGCRHGSDCGSTSRCVTRANRRS